MFATKEEAEAAAADRNAKHAAQLVENKARAAERAARRMRPLSETHIMLTNGNDR